MANSQINGKPAWVHKSCWTLAWVIMIAIIVIGCSRIHFDVNPLRLLPQSLPEVKGLTAYIDHFSRPDELILAIDGPDANAVEEATSTLAARLRARPDLASQVIDRPPGEEDPGAMADLVAHILINQPPAQLDALADKLSGGQSAKRIEETLEKMTFDPSPAVALLGGYDPLRLVESAFGGGSATMAGPKFGSDDGRLRLIYLWAEKPLAREDYLKLIDWTNEVRQLIKTWRTETNAPVELRVRLTGEPAIMSEVSSGMQSDLMGSGFSTGFLVAAIFWIVYRRMIPLLALLAMLTLGGLLTFGLSGLIVRDLNAMNVGFGAILIGLTVDYGILIFQQNLITPGDPRRIRAAVRAGIFGASSTTAASFLALHVGSQPSLAALGSIVAIGTLASAGLMLFLFVPWIARLMPKPGPPTPPPAWLCLGGHSAKWVAILCGIALSLAGAVLWHRGFPSVDGSDRSTRPRSSEAYAALDDVQNALTGGKSMSSLVVHAADPLTLRRDLESIRPKLEDQTKSGALKSFYLPVDFIPVPDHARNNIAGAIPRMLGEEPRLKIELSDAGFGPESAMLLESVFLRFRQAANSPDTPFLTANAQWMIQRLVSCPTADGSIWAAANLEPRPGASLASLQSEEVFLADWEQTTRAIQTRIPREFGRIFTMLGVLVVLLLIVTFRRLADIVWVGISLALSSILTLAVMTLAGWSWNFVNAAAVLICLGCGSDYSIHMLLALRRSASVPEALADTGQAIVVCTLTSVVGFGSLAWASNLGLASLGQVCALALGLNCLIATYLLPFLWHFVHRAAPSPK